MSDGENFAARWSRLKQEATKSKAARPGATSDKAPEEKAAAGAKDAPGFETPNQAKEPPFDPATLPPIESIAAGTDIRAFLQSGVPVELTKAALRRAWSADPAIRDFIEMAENQWDFTNPAAIPGFGPLLPRDDAGQLAAQAMGKLAEATEAEPTSSAAVQPGPDRVATAAATSSDSQVPGIPDGSTRATEACPPVKVGELGEFAASQHVDPSASVGQPNRRGHGRALPK
jgi:hypothetical protein